MAVSCLSLSITNLTVTPPTKSLKQLRTQKSLNSTLKSLSKSGKLDEALHLLLESHQSRTPFGQPNLESYTTLLHACISRKSLSHGRRLYLHLLQSEDDTDLLKNPTLSSKFITLFSVCGQLDEARRVFRYGVEEMDRVPESVYVAMAIGFSKNGNFRDALLIYWVMLSKGVEPGNFAFSVALRACSGIPDIRNGKAVHAQIIKAREEPDQVVYNALLRLYTESGSFDEVLKLFDDMPDRNVATWNALLAGFFKNNQVVEGLQTFRKMQREKVGYSWVSLTIILAVSARLTALYIGKEVHGQIVKSAECPDVLVLNSLLDMYAKCGLMDCCRKVFDGMPFKDLTSWNTLINGYAINGWMSEAMTAFEQMSEAGFRADEVTLISLLSGCSHAGMTNEGRILFDRMRTEFGIDPNLEHYACLVDMLGRAGRIEEALKVVKKMPMEPSGSIWGSLLNSCRLHGYVSLAEVIAKLLFKIEPSNPGNYVMLSNIYANAGMWDRVKLVRELMERRGIKKEAGCSWVQIRDRAHGFVAGGGFEFRNSDEYRKVWNELTKEMEKSGYTPDTGVVLHDINEEMKVEWVCGHSERLATIFALIHTGSGLPIRITKNLRVCTDCHAWMKHASKVSKRKIILRDTNRFHHFHEGKCSCNDYW
ncbi:pentatricopeptide repeat-containing protein At3g14330 [Sesamum indicum]|uniref:Pentatricopeptide repeat-containing protein At3g14330 n=1 Tax=Sesamum indicum TaxID=4182 RepID=A0A6I9TMJ7_SESIN|nr:pentatricopeptide repeat-containing protein At3g14330 [Sesamum indicum]